MERFRHNMADLFAQLGRPASAKEIACFITAHQPLDGDVRLHDATFWTTTQSEFLREALLEDSDWSATVDQLNSEMHNLPKSRLA